MLNKGNSKILKIGNKENLEGYPSIKLSYFWRIHQEKVKQKLFIELKDNPEYDIARRLINEFEMSNNIDKQIPIYINMLNKGNSKILKSGNKETLEGYPSIKLSYFWNAHQEKVKQKLFIELKNNQEYDVARRTVLKYYNVITYEKLKSKQALDINTIIDIYINMLNKGNSKILKSGNKETLEGYPSINLSQFWNRHKEKIIQKLFVELKDNSEYDLARRLIEEHVVSNNIDKQIPIYINMLNKGNSKILKIGNKENLEGYPSIKLSYFWRIHQEKVKQKLFIELKDNPEYDIARRLINEFEMSNNIDKQIPIYINMLNKGNDSILKFRNKEVLEGYPSINLSQFWTQYKEKVKQKLFIELKDNPEYDIARQTVLKYCKVSSIEEYYEKERKSKELNELKKMKKVLETAEQGLTEEAIEGRKRA